MTERYLEDFTVGHTFRSGRLRVDAEQIITFARMAKIFELIFPQEVAPLHRLRCGLSSASLRPILSITMDGKA